MPMTVSKTREMLVDVARQLFARMGVDNTTMNDIAQASKKGRRTLYTYFKSKNEIYLAVVGPTVQDAAGCSSERLAGGRKVDDISLCKIGCNQGAGVP